MLERPIWCQKKPRKATSVPGTVQRGVWTAPANPTDSPVMRRHSGRETEARGWTLVHAPGFEVDGVPGEGRPAEAAGAEARRAGAREHERVKVRRTHRWVRPALARLGGQTASSGSSGATRSHVSGQRAMRQPRQGPEQTTGLQAR